MTDKKQPSQDDYAALGKAIRQVFADDYFNVIETRRRFLWINFVKGIVTGLGGAIGATLLVTLVIWLLSIGVDIPIIGSFLQSIKDAIQ